MKKFGKVTYIFPVHNENKYLKKQISLFLNIIKKNKLPLNELILIEHGSIDKTWDRCKELSKRNKKILSKRINIDSYGLAVKHGLLSSNSDIIVLLNVNFFDIHFIKKTLPLTKKYNVVNSSGIDNHEIKVFKNSKNLKNILNSMISKHDLFDLELIFKLKDSVINLPIKSKKNISNKYSLNNRIKKTLIDLTRLSFYYLFGDKTKVTKIIKVADDFGMDETTNSAIIDLYNSKQIDVISVLPNMVSKNDLEKLRKTVKNENLAAHINLVRGKPLSKPELIPSLVNENGIFYSLPEFIFKLIIKKIDFNELQLEVENQIIFLNKNKIKPKHLNSERHTHIYQPLFSIIKQTAKKYKIHHVRNIKDIEYHLSWKIHKYLVLKIIGFLLSKIYNLTPEYNKKITEIISHPGSNFD